MSGERPRQVGDDGLSVPFLEHLEVSFSFSFAFLCLAILSPFALGFANGDSLNLSKDNLRGMTTHTIVRTLSNCFASLLFVRVKARGSQVKCLVTRWLTAILPVLGQEKASSFAAICDAFTVAWGRDVPALKHLNGPFWCSFELANPSEETVFTPMVRPKEGLPLRLRRRVHT